MMCDPDAFPVDHERAKRAVFVAEQMAEREHKAWQMALDSGRYLERAHYEEEPGKVDIPCDPEILWYRDHGYYTGPEVAAEISDEDRRFAFSAEGEYLALCKERTGDDIPDDVLEKRSRQSAELLAMSEAIAKKMGEAGYNAYRETPFELFRYFVHSRQRDQLPSYRRTTFIPWVAQQLRAPMVAALEYWLSRNPHDRFWTFTSGKRVQLPMLKERHKEFCAKLADLNEQSFMKETGAQLVFIAEELGTPEFDEYGNTVDGSEIERDENGQLCFHLHGHAVVHMAKGWVPPEKWSQLLRKVHAFWPHVFLEGGAIRNARECCKYLTKPGEMLKLTGPELVALQEQLYRQKMVRPLGELRAEIEARETAGKRLVKRQTNDGRVYYAVKNWNRHARRTSTEKAQDAAARLSPISARGGIRITSRGTPQFGRAGIAEPVVTVMAIRGSWDETAVRAHPLVAPVIRATTEEWQAGLRLKVHTRTLTPETKPATEADWRKSGMKRHRKAALAVGN